jgi:hypothetical protein
VRSKWSYTSALPICLNGVERNGLILHRWWI